MYHHLKNTKIFYHSSSVLPEIDGKNAIYITDSNTTHILKKAQNYNSKIPIIEIPQGEQYKNIKTIEKILTFAVKHSLDRHSIFIGFGGGVILDMTGFASSIYMRGSSSILIPTTLLSMVDACIGGKTGVDFLGLKNLIGTFYIPNEVYISDRYLNSLPNKQYYSGLAELIKISLINRPLLYQKIKENLSLIKMRLMPNFIQIIKEAIEGKKEIVEKDFYEENIRSYLNLGHTFAHALEAILDFKEITHGEAVAWGIVRALEFGTLIGKTNENYKKQVSILMKELGYSVDAIPNYLTEKIAKNHYKEVDITHKKIASLLIEKMKMDKKNKDGKIRLVLQKDLGECFIYEAKEKEIIEVFI